jgi:hypothetical protein
MNAVRKLITLSLAACLMGFISIGCAAKTSTKATEKATTPSPGAGSTTNKAPTAG